MENSYGTLKEDNVVTKSSLPSSTSYPGDFVDESPPPEGGYRLNEGLSFEDPFILLCFFDPDVTEGKVALHKWQMDDLKLLGQKDKRPTSQHPFKYCLAASNGSGKDKYIIAPFAVWFTLSKIRSRIIITTASGTQLTSQTEPYIKDLCEKVNAHFKQEIYRIRQRYIKCTITGSEIRMFATDEAGKAEGYHPIDADSEMAIVENEAKSIAEDIDKALRRCSGYNYWLKVSSVGEPKGHFYKAFTSWPNCRRVTSYECLHVSRDEIAEDEKLDGKHSAFFRSKHLSLFTSLEGSNVIPIELINYCKEYPPKYVIDLQERIGIDLAAGGAENSLCRTKGNKCIAQKHFREKDTTICAQRIDSILKQWGIEKSFQYIYADDGGVGRAIIDMLVKMGWHINRVMNQWAAVGNKHQFGNRGAENWWRVARIFEEKLFDVNTLDDLTLEQLSTRNYSQKSTGKIYLQDKREAIAAGYPSPDRADAFILSMTGLTVEDFLNGQKHESDNKKLLKTRYSSKQIEEEYANDVTFSAYNENQKPPKGRVYTSLRNALHSSN